MDKHSLYETIKFVAIYLRKSRGDEDKDLIKHEQELILLCKKNNWRYVIYKEVGTSDSIEMRPKMLELLEDVEEGLYDAVVVIDIDRLSRGDEEDRGKYLNILRRSETYIVTPDKIYDLYDDNDDLHISVKGLLAREEYKAIKKRLRNGKIRGSRMGQWTNGIPPFPYEYERWQNKYNQKSLVVNDDKLKIYRFIIESVINDRKTTQEIAWELNKNKVPSPRNTKWTNVTIGRLLVDETHLGKIITNKSIGDGHKKKKSNAKDYKKLSKSEWRIVENCHEPVKTIEEHEEILIFLSRKKRTPSKQKAKILPLSGLVKCSMCGHTMQITYREDRKSSESIKPCWYRDAYGNKCPNRGGLTKYIYDDLPRQIIKYKESILNEADDDNNEDLQKLLNDIDLANKQISNKKKAKQRVQEAYEEEEYTLEEYKERKNKYDQEIEILNKEIQILEIKIKNSQKVDKSDKIQIIDDFLILLENNNLTSDEINLAYKKIIDIIIWERIDNNINIKVTFV